MTEKPIPKHVLIELLGRYEWLNTKMIKRMRERYGTRFIMLAGSEAVRNRYLPFSSNQDQIILLDEIDCLAVPDQETDAVFRTARVNENMYGVNYLLDIIQQDRSIFGAFMSYAGSSWSKRRFSGLGSLYARINHYFEWSNNLVEQEAIDFMVLRPGGLLATTLTVVAAHKKIPITMSRPSRYKSYLTWTYGPYSGHQIFEEAYNNLAGEKFTPLPLEAICPPEGSRQVFEKFLQQRAVKSFIRSTTLALYNHIVNRLNALRAASSYQGPSLFGVLSDLFYSWCSSIRLNLVSEGNLSIILEKPYVIFLLPKEPEYTVQSLARKFSNVQAIVQQLSLCMPAGYNLVVKEHSRIGFRRFAFYKDLLKLPNLILCNPEIPGALLIARSSAVATIAGTAGIEATLMGKKTLIFTSDVEYNFLPSVSVIHSFQMLDSAVKEAVRDETVDAVEKIRISGARYIAAILTASYDAPNTKVFEGNDPISEEELNKSIGLFIRSFQMQRAHVFNIESVSQIERASFK